jgi:hypothetical protein
VGPDARHERRYLCVRRSESPRHAEATTGGHAGNLPGKSLNAGLTSRTAITSPSSPTLPHARLNPRNSSTHYDAHEPRHRLGCGKLGKHSGRLRQAKLLGEKAKRPGGNSPTLPRGGFPDKVSRLGFDMPRWTATYDGTCQLPSTVTLLYFPLCPSP